MVFRLPPPAAIAALSCAFGLPFCSGCTTDQTTRPSVADGGGGGNGLPQTGSFTADATAGGSDGGTSNAPTEEPNDAGPGPAPSDASIGPDTHLQDYPSKMQPPTIPVTFTTSDGGTCGTSQLCAVTWTGAPLPSSIDALTTALVGTWVLCGTLSAFDGTDEGVEIDADGTWYRLYAVNGALTRGQGIADHGTWNAAETPGNLSLAFRYVTPGFEGGSLAWLFVPALGSMPRTLRIENGDIVADYVVAGCP
jgi:hypothetical protein